MESEEELSFICIKVMVYGKRRDEITEKRMKLRDED